MTIDELLEHYRYKLTLPNLTQHSRTIAEDTYRHLEKRKPIKVGVTHYHDGSIEDSCRACYEGVTEAMNYCPYCGQAIDWEDRGMNRIDLAIDALSELSKDAEIEESEEVLNMAVNALKKQKPMKAGEYQDGGYSCPGCCCYIGYKHNYCSFCGQRLE